MNQLTRMYSGPRERHKVVSLWHSRTGIQCCHKLAFTPRAVPIQSIQRKSERSGLYWPEVLRKVGTELDVSWGGGARGYCRHG